MIISPEDITKLILAVLIGGIIGFEREIHNKAAGLRTIALISLGATLFTMLSEKYGDSRMAANIVTGIGFLGAGAIVLSEGRVRGLTTASAIWVAASAGMAIGLGRYELAGAVALVAVMVLWGLARFDRWLESRGRESRTYEVTLTATDEFAKINETIKQCGLKIRTHKTLKHGMIFLGVWEVYGKSTAHDSFVKAMLKDESVRELRY